MNLDWLMRNPLSVQNKSTLSLGSVTTAIRLLGKFISDFSKLSIVKMAFTSVDDFQTALNACVSVRDWETLTESIQIPEVMVPMAFARLTELTLEEIEVSFIIIGLLAPFTPYNIVSLL